MDVPQETVMRLRELLAQPLPVRLDACNTLARYFKGEYGCFLGISRDASLPVDIRWTAEKRYAFFEYEGRRMQR
jgi:hypothetical protein